MNKITYSVEQRVFLLLEYHRLYSSPTSTLRSFQSQFKTAKGPDAETICELSEKSERLGSVAYGLVGNVGPSQSAVTHENVPTVSAIIQHNAKKSIRRYAAESGLKQSSTHTILRNTLHTILFKIQCHKWITV